jgi:hypothetical protein
MGIGAGEPDAERRPHMDRMVVGMVVPLGAFALAGFIVYVAMKSARLGRELLSRERLAAIEKGHDISFMTAPREMMAPSSLSSGLTLVAVGAGLAFALRVLLPFHHGGPWGFGVMIALIGVAQLLYWFIGGKQEWERRRELDEELRRAYLERLRSSGPPSDSK